MIRCGSIILKENGSTEKYSIRSREWNALRFFKEEEGEEEDRSPEGKVHIRSTQDAFIIVYNWPSVIYISSKRASGEMCCESGNAAF